MTLSRTRPTPPIRMVHLGLGNFFRAHQAWYTHHASDASEWGYAAFGGRSGSIVNDLRSQDNVYSLAVNAADGDRFEKIESIAMSYMGSEHDAWISLCAAPATAIISTTVTEAGYCSDGAGGVEHTDDVVADIATLRAGGVEMRTAPGRLVAGLRARRAAESGSVALMSCDNLSDNGIVMKQVTRAMAAEVDSSLVSWIDENVSFVTTMVDRITPRTTDADIARVRDGIGADDRVPVVTEPFAEWVIDGDFPAGRPDWESAGAVFSRDIHANERRKLWLLNGSHSLLAYVGLVQGCTTVADAMTDPFSRETAQLWWDSALTVLEGDAAKLRAYTDALRSRFENPRIQYQLAQIATDGSLKIPVRWLPGLDLLRAQGQLPVAIVRGLAAFALYLQGDDVRDVNRDSLLAVVSSDPNGTLRAVLGMMAPRLLNDDELLAAIDAQLRAFVAN